MSKSETLRVLVSERLTAAAEEICELFERTIAEYEEELRRYRERNHRKLNLTIKLVSGNVQIPSTSRCPGPKTQICESEQIKEEPEEQSIKQEEEQLPGSVSESSAVCERTEESSLLQQIQTEHEEETQGEDISSETHFHSKTEGHSEHSSDTDDDDNWEPSRCSAALMDTEADGDHDNQVQTKDISTELPLQNTSGPETTVLYEDMSAADGKKYQCSVCKKRFSTRPNVRRHMIVHTGEKPFGCPVCEKAFNLKCNLVAHMRIHTGEKPFSCPACYKAFHYKGDLDKHLIKKHRDEKPYSCLFCDKAFSDKSNLFSHMRIHTGESSTET